MEYMEYTNRAVNDGLLEIVKQNGKNYVYYGLDRHRERYDDPEEKVRAEYWSELVYRYGYKPETIGLEITIPDRVDKDRADIVIFTDSGKKQPFAVIECKREGIKDMEFSQAVEQAFGNGAWVKFKAKYVAVIAGNTRKYFDLSNFAIRERDKNIVADIPNKYGKPLDYKYYKGSDLDIKAVSKSELMSAIHKCHQTLWGGGRLSPATAFSELCKLIFIKIIDEKQPRKKGEPYEFQIKTHETADELSERIHTLYETQRYKKGNEGVLTEKIKINPTVIMTLVSHLESINLSETEIDVKGFAFERFMDGFFKGSYGQYFTPRELIKFIVDMMNPSRDSLIIDPACGSGGFLLHVFDKIRKQADEYAEKDSAEHNIYWSDFARNNLFGIEINEDIAQVAKMNMIIHGDGHTNVACADSLRPFDSIKSTTRNDSFDKEKFDYVLTNPPFGSNISSVEYPFISQYELGKSTTRSGKLQPKKNQKSEVLFIERCLEFLKKGTGKMAIILPDGVLSNSSMQYVRDYLMEKTQILAIISFPQLAFKQYGAGVKSSVIFCRKKADFEGEINYKIFMAIAENVGYDSTGRKATENDLDIILDEYRKQHGQG